MSVLQIVTTADAGFASQWDALRGKLSLSSHLLDDQGRLNAVREIIEEIRRDGDAGLARCTAKFDQVTLEPSEFRIGEDVMQEAHGKMRPELLEALRRSIENVRDYQERIKAVQCEDWSRDGMRLGLRYTPLKRVGLCIPGASAPLLSTVIMTAVPAQVAGVKEIAVISAPRCEGSIHPDILGLCYELGIKDVYRVSGAQAVAALAFGTESVKKVDKIVGPSNWWGQLAKKEVFGLVDIDSFAGPSEVMILADDTARPEFLAADMLSQAEHAPGSAILVTDSDELAERTAAALEQQIQELDRSEATAECVRDFSLAIVTQSIAEAIEIANDFAAEHLQIQCKDSDAVAEQIINAGAIFVGSYTPVATGDYYAGPSHTLPTGSSAAFFSALNVNDFLKQSSLISFSEAGLKQAAGAIDMIARAEGLDAHARSVTRRVEK